MWQLFNANKILSYCPADGRVLGDLTTGIRPASPTEIDVVVRRASAAFEQWKTSSFAARRRLLRTLQTYLLAHADELATASCLDTGKTRVDAALGEILVTAEKISWTITHGERALAPERRPTNLLMSYKRNSVIYEPLGVVAACVSWNYALHNMWSPVVSALFAGNAIVVKPSEHTAWSAKYFVDILRAALESCGHPPDLVQAVVCLPAQADALTAHPALAHLIFIGSRPVGHAVATAAARALTPMTAELGGKDPCLVLDDAATRARLPSISSILMRGVFQASGQNCVGIERIIALPGVYERIIELVAPRIRSLRLGSVLLEERDRGSAPDMGAMVSRRSFAQVEQLIADAVSRGAVLHMGGHRLVHQAYPHGHYFEPTLLSDVTPDMPIAQEELFAPVFILMRARDAAQAVQIANACPYSLGASVFGDASSPATKMCVDGIRAGMVAVNDFGVYYAVSLPFGGVAGSGYGRFGGVEGLRALSNVKAICEDWIPGVRTAIPPVLDYPDGGGEEVDGKEKEKENKKKGNSWEFSKGVIETGYNPGLVGKATGVARIFRNM